MLNVVAMLLVASLVLIWSMNYMASNIGDFETLPMPPKKEKKVKRYTTNNPTIKVDAKAKDSWTLLDFSTGKFHRVADPEKVAVLLHLVIPDTDN